MSRDKYQHVYTVTVFLKPNGGYSVYLYQINIFSHCAAQCNSLILSNAKTINLLAFKNLACLFKTFSCIQFYSAIKLIFLGKIIEWVKVHVQM